MPIDEQTVRHIGLLARILLSEEEVKLFSEQLGGILQYVEKLNELDTSGVEPLAHVGAHVNVLRADQVRESLTPDEATSNAPDRDGPFFRVPKVVE